MDTAFAWALAVPGIIFLLLVVPLWVVFHYLTAWKRIRAGTAGPGRVAVDSAELEVEFVAKRNAEGGGGVKFWVVTAEGKAAIAEETTHRFKLSLKPLDSSGKPVKVSRRR